MSNAEVTRQVGQNFRDIDFLAHQVSTKVSAKKIAFETPWDLLNGCTEFVGLGLDHVIGKLTVLRFSQAVDGAGLWGICKWLA